MKVMNLKCQKGAVTKAADRLIRSSMMQGGENVVNPELIYPGTVFTSLNSQ